VTGKSRRVGKEKPEKSPATIPISRSQKAEIISAKHGITAAI
jgi:hypothetical protein